MLTPKELGAFIRQLRQEKGWTQKQLAENLLVTDKAVSRWERGLGFPDIQFLEPLADTLDVSMQELISAKKDLSSETVDLSALQELFSSPETVSQPPQNSIQDIIDEFSEARNLFQKKVKKRKWIIRVVLALLLIICIVWFVPVPQRISRTLTGETWLPDGETYPVTVTIQGYVWHHFFEGNPLQHNFYFHRCYFSGDITITSAAIEDSPVTWHFTGKRTGHADESPGSLLPLYDPPGSNSIAFYHFHRFTTFDATDIRFSPDCTRIVITASDSLHGATVVAAEDPYTDYQKLFDTYHDLLK